MTTSNFCSACGAKLNENSQFCSMCGAPSKGGLTSSNNISPKSGFVTFILCLFFGTLGIHRFYVGKIGTGLLMFITAGGFGFWYLYDLISIAINNFTDDSGRTVEITKNPSGAKTFFMVLGAIFTGFAILFACFFLLIFMLVGGLAEVAQDQLAAIRAGNIEKAYSYNSYEFRKAVSLQEFKNFLDQYPQFKNSISASFPEREFKNDTGKIEGTLKSANGSETPIVILLVKENGEWKIVNIDIDLTPAGTKVKK